jgi:hypothetical protein
MLGINTAHRFKDLPDGRMYFYPHGRNGRSYLVRDRLTRDRLERNYRVLGWIGGVFIAVTLDYAIRHGQWLLALGGLILPAIEWLMGERAAEHLVEASETYTAAELRERVLEQRGYGNLIFMVVASVVFVLAAAVMLWRHPARWMIGLSGLLLFGASAITSAREIQQKQHMNQQKCSRAR